MIYRRPSIVAMAVALMVSALHAQNSGIQIQSLRLTNNGLLTVEIVTRQSSSSPKNERIVLLTDDARTRGFRLVEDRNGEDAVLRFSGSSTWFGEELMLRHPATRLFVVHCVLSERAAYSSDQFKLRGLPFAEAESIEHVMSLLNDFQWRPIGYTFAEVPQARR